MYRYLQVLHGLCGPERLHGFRYLDPANAYSLGPAATQEAAARARWHLLTWCNVRAFRLRRHLPLLIAYSGVAWLLVFDWSHSHTSTTTTFHGPTSIALTSPTLLKYLPHSSALAFPRCALWCEGTCQHLYPKDRMAGRTAIAGLEDLATTTTTTQSSMHGSRLIERSPPSQKWTPSTRRSTERSCPSEAQGLGTT